MRGIKFRVSEGQKTIGYERVFDGRWFASAGGTDWADGTYHGQRLKRWQYTGRNDKNGAEIYEGDIVNITLNFETPDEEYWKDENVAVTWADDGWDVGDEPLGLYTESDDWDRTIEVIGNVYSNPELTK